MVVDFDLGESSEVVGHQHHRDVDVLQLPEMFFVSLCKTCKMVQKWCTIGKKMV